MLEFPRADGWRVGPGAIALVTGVGIVTGLGVTRASGCDASQFPWILEWTAQPPWRSAGLNVLLSAVLLALAGMSIATPRPIAVGLMAMEFVGFGLFLLLFRGGYSVGFAGQPLSEVLQFDLVSAGCRGGMLAPLAFGANARSGRRISLAIAGALCGIAIVGVKLRMFPGPRW